MAARTIIGHKVRRLRRHKGVSQVAMARELGISPSYLNLIEHNQRPLTLELLLKLSKIFDIDLQTFSEEEEARLLADLDEVFGDPLFRAAGIDQDDVGELVGSAPEIGRAIVALYTAYRNADDNVSALTERMSDDSFRAASAHELLTLLTTIRSFSEILHDNPDLPPGDSARFLGIIVAESERVSAVVDKFIRLSQGEALEGLLGAKSAEEQVTDLIEANTNHFPDLEDAAERLRRSAKVEQAGIYDGLLRHLTERHEVAVEVVPVNRPVTRTNWYDADERRLFLSEMLPPSRLVFQLARHAGRLDESDLFATHLEEAGLSDPEAEALYRDTLAKYFAAAVLMPYDAFYKAAFELRHDIELLKRRFGTSFEQICHRLTTLQRPGQKGIPFHLIRVDIAGNISKRYGGSGLRIPRFGGACPRWNVYAAFLRPFEIRTQFSRMLDGTAYFNIARTVVKEGVGYHDPASYFTIGIGCEAAHARQLVYADGIDLEQPDVAVPVGVTCRLCDRSDCRQRAFPPLTHRLETSAAPPAKSGALT